MKPEFKRLAFDNERKKITGQQIPAADQRK
jgi:hypothetical protein